MARLSITDPVDNSGGCPWFSPYCQALLNSDPTSSIFWKLQIPSRRRIRTGASTTTSEGKFALVVEDRVRGVGMERSSNVKASSALQGRRWSAIHAASWTRRIQQLSWRRSESWDFRCRFHQESISISPVAFLKFEGVQQGIGKARVVE